MKIYFIEISETENVETTDLLQLVSIEKRKKLDRYRFQIDSKLSLYAELLVRQQAMCLLGLDNNEIEFGANNHGKPFLQGHPSFHFNISHTRNAVVAAFSNEEVGIDIEKVESADFEIINRFFTFSEKNYILSHENADRAFYEIWTKKEAYIKCIGTGLTKSLKTFNTLDNEKNYILMYVGEYIISICCNESVPKSPHLIILTEKELVSFF